MREGELIPLQQAIQMLPDGDEIHTFRQRGEMLAGCNWKRKDIIKTMKKFKVKRAGPSSVSLKHGLVCKDEDVFGSSLFIATKD